VRIGRWGDDEEEEKNQRLRQRAKLGFELRSPLTLGRLEECAAVKKCAAVPAVRSRASSRRAVRSREKQCAAVPANIKQCAAEQTSNSAVHSRANSASSLRV